jgi:Flp pilus assembly protein TadD
MDSDRDAGASKRGNKGSNGDVASGASDRDRLYDRAFRLAESGKRDEARELYLQLDADGVDPRLRAEAINNLAVLDGLEDRHHASRNGFKRALSIDPACENARRNLAMLESCGCGGQDDCDVNPA